jgi:microcystin-dependent protein
MATAAVTYTFANGTNADGTQVNANFTSVVNFLNTDVIQKDGSIAFTSVPSIATATDPTTDNQLARKAYVDNYTPAGVITQYGGATAPTGWVLCRGQAISRSNALYTRLFAAISTTYGAGDGTTTFNVPNLQGRIPVGFDSTQTEFDALAETGGSKTSTLITANLPSHQHGVGTLVSTGIADHVHSAGTFAIAAHDGNHYHSNAHSHNMTSTGSTTTDGGHTHGSGSIQFGGWVARWQTFTGITYAIPQVAYAGADPMAVTYADGNSGSGHNHSVSVSGTTSSQSVSNTGYQSGLAAMVHTFTGSTGPQGAFQPVLSGSTALEGSGTAFNNLAPYIVVNYIIKL